MLFRKRFVYTLQGLWFLIYILSKTDRFEVQIDSKEGYLTLWCHQPHLGQSLKSSNSGRIRRPRGGVRLDFSKSIEFGGSKTQL